MALLSVRMSDEEKKALNSFAQIQGETLSTVARKILIERMEDEEDIADYKKALAKNEESFSMEQVGKELGLF